MKDIAEGVNLIAGMDMASVKDMADSDSKAPVSPVPVDPVGAASSPLPSRPAPPTPSSSSSPFSGRSGGKFSKADTKSSRSSRFAKSLLDSVKLKDFAVNFMVPLISFGVALLLGFFVIYPSISSKPEVEQELATKEELNTVLTDKVATLERLIDFKDVVSQNSELVDRVLVSEDLVPELLSQIDFIARSAGLDITRLNSQNRAVDPKKESTTMPQVEVSLGVVGNFNQFIVFLENTENAARLVNISNFGYSANSKDPNVLNFNLSLVSPYLYVNSSAVVDEPVGLDVSNNEFVSLVNKVKEMKYYDPETLAPVEEIVPEVTEESVEEGSETADGTSDSESAPAPAEGTSTDTPSE
jgi:Tfp pilus assembly protein PilO